MVDFSGSSTTSFLNATLAKERPIFGRRHVPHDPPHPVTHLVAANGKVVLVLANKSIQRFDLHSADATPETVDLAKTIGVKSKPYAAFLDPTGTHLVISLKQTVEDMQPDLVYLSRRSTKPRMSTKIRGNLVTAVGWNVFNKSESTSGVVLVGTSMGLVFETEFDSGEDRLFSTGSLERQWKQVLDLGKGRHLPISGLQFYYRGNRCHALVATPHQLYQYTGKVNDPESKLVLSHIFKNDRKPYKEASSLLKYSLLSCSHAPACVGKAKAALPLLPTKYAWLTEEGVLSGPLDYTQKNAVNSGDVIALPFAANEKGAFPHSMILTEYHALLAYTERVVAVSMLNQAIVCDDQPGGGESTQIKGVSRDVVTGVIYAYSDYSIYEYTVEKEERNVWKDYLLKQDFVTAAKFCLGDEDKLDEVLCKQADHLFAKGKHVESAKCYAKTRKGFEEIALKLMPLPEKTALLTFLHTRLDLVKPTETTQLTMLVVWLFEIYLNLMGGGSNKTGSSGDPFGGVEEAEDAVTAQTSNEMFDLMKIPKVRETVANNKMTFYELLGSHGDKKNMIKFGHELKDYDRVIRIHLQDNEYLPALKVLKTLRRPEMFYHYGPLLMPEIPMRFVTSIIEQGKSLSPSRMIPSLVVSNRETQELESIRYLEFCIKSLANKEPVIHNFLLSLYVKHQPEKVFMYLESQHQQGGDGGAVCFDVNYVLRLCTEKKGGQLRKACVLLHCMLGQVDQAVELALEDADLDQAKACLQFVGSSGGEEADQQVARRRIWLRIAKYVVQDKNDIKQAMDLLKETKSSEGGSGGVEGDKDSGAGDLVKIEDVLPFFPDFVTIDDFKEAICDSLQEYSKHIQDLKDEMEEAYDAAKSIREDIHKFKSRYIFARATDVCSICETYLLAKPFHLFICGHKFHTDCLVAAVLPHLTPARRRKVKELQAVLANPEVEESAPPPPISNNAKKQEADAVSVGSQMNVIGGGSGGGGKLSRKEQARNELDDLIAHECIFCGEIMIKMIDKPFIDDQEFNSLMQEWL